MPHAAYCRVFNNVLMRDEVYCTSCLSHFEIRNSEGFYTKGCTMAKKQLVLNPMYACKKYSPRTEGLNVCAIYKLQHPRECIEVEMLP